MDDWVTVAMTNDSLVAELLIRLKHCSENPPPPRKPSVMAAAATVPPLVWGVRQPRSRPVLRCTAAPMIKEREPARDSPTTPLSWSGAASVSTAADGIEESSLPTKFSPGDRSKVTATNEAVTTTSNSRRPRKKKTFSELKEEECLLLKEQISLKNELEALLMTLDEKRTENVSLKRKKLECDMLRSSAQKKAATPDVAVEAVTNQTHQMNDLLVLDSCSIVQKDVARVQEDVATDCFLLPDLNMMPSEGDFGAEALYGVS